MSATEDEGTEETKEAAPEEKAEFDPSTVPPEGLEYFRRKEQAESDRKVTAAEQRIQRRTEEQRQAEVEKQETEELQRMAAEGDTDGIGQRVIAQMQQQSVVDEAQRVASNTIEQDMIDKFADTLGETTVAQIRSDVEKAGGAHAEFALALAEASAEKARGENTEAEVTAILVKKGLLKREEIGGADDVGPTGSGSKPSSFDEIEAGYVAGDIGDDEYEAALEAKDEQEK